ncbi:MAG: aminodeoxychorismate/anthranilate synthase component II [Selenomonadaceae bacterium]
MILLLDNYDSFTYNLYQYFEELGVHVDVVRNDCITIEGIEERQYEAIVISPGAGTPKDAGISKAAVLYFAGRLPILGICLGHQVIGEAFGGTIIRTTVPIHGKVSKLLHDSRGSYRNLFKNAVVGRYHSLIIDKDSIPDCLEVSAQLEDGTIMGVRHKKYNIEGMQFHPESILTPEGKNILQSWLTK